MTHRDSLYPVTNYWHTTKIFWNSRIRFQCKLFCNHSTVDVIEVPIIIMKWFISRFNRFAIGWQYYSLILTSTRYRHTAAVAAAMPQVPVPVPLFERTRTGKLAGDCSICHYNVQLVLNGRDLMPLVICSFIAIRFRRGGGRWRSSIYWYIYPWCCAVVDMVSVVDRRRMGICGIGPSLRIRHNWMSRWNLVLWIICIGYR